MGTEPSLKNVVRQTTSPVPAAGVLVKVRAAAGARGSNDGPCICGRGRDPEGMTASEGAAQRKTDGARRASTRANLCIRNGRTDRGQAGGAEEGGWPGVRA